MQCECMRVRKCVSVVPFGCGDVAVIFFSFWAVFFCHYMQIFYFFFFFLSFPHSSALFPPSQTLHGIYTSNVFTISFVFSPLFLFFRESKLFSSPDLFQILIFFLRILRRVDRFGMFFGWRCGHPKRRAMYVGNVPILIIPYLLDHQTMIQWGYHYQLDNRMRVVSYRPASF